MGSVSTVKSFTYDISAGGIFINSPERPPAGALVTLEVCLPIREPRGQTLQLHGTGRVVRWIENGASRGFAVANRFSWTLSRPRREVATIAM